MFLPCLLVHNPALHPRPSPCLCHLPPPITPTEAIPSPTSTPPAAIGERQLLDQPGLESRKQPWVLHLPASPGESAIREMPKGDPRQLSVVLRDCTLYFSDDEDSEDWQKMLPQDPGKERNHLLEPPDYLILKPQTVTKAEIKEEAGAGDPPDTRAGGSLQSPSTDGETRDDLKMHPEIRPAHETLSGKAEERLVQRRGGEESCSRSCAGEDKERGLPGEQTQQSECHEDGSAGATETQQQPMVQRAFACEECRTIFKCQENFRAHMKTHTRERLYICTHCGVSFSPNDKSTKFTRSSTVDEIYSCPNCVKNIFPKQELPGDQTPIVGESPYKCAECEKCFPSGGDLTEHQTLHLEKCCPCPECEKSVSQSSGLNHDLRMHKGEKPDQCAQNDSCGSRLLKHWNMHTEGRPCKCPECEKSFIQYSALTEHKSNRTGERPYKCPDCEKDFMHRSDVIAHHRLHTGKRLSSSTECETTFNIDSALGTHQQRGGKLYKCACCGKGFSQKCNLARHQRIHTGEKPFTCTKCGRSFRQKMNLVGHWRIHTGEKPYKCNVCKRSFSWKGNLLTHQRKHTGESPYKCNVCTRSFSQKGNLLKHLRLHSGERPFPCTDCGESFLYKRRLLRHRAIHMEDHNGQRKQT